jgi:hypothetical protein
MYGVKMGVKKKMSTILKTSEQMFKDFALKVCMCSRCDIEREIKKQNTCLHSNATDTKCPECHAIRVNSSSVWIYTAGK